MSKSIYTVSSLVRYLKFSIDNDMQLQSILIKGEISNFTNHRSGHWYFTLKDAKAKLSCVMFASYASRCKIMLKEGMQVIVHASLSVYEAQGNCQLYVTSVQVDGLGDLYLQYEQIKEKLSKEGLFDPAHKKEIPQYPEHIVLISAKEGAAIQDMYTTINRRWPLTKITFLPSLVQGKDAAFAILETLQKAENLQSDLIILARGGGAIEDLWCFNDETLARYIYAMHTVIITGVGHETDTTLVDYVSDARAATPTAAAELATPDIQEVHQLLMSYKKHMVQESTRLLQQNKMQFTRLAQSRYMKDPLSYIREEQMKVAMHTKELEHITRRLEQANTKLQTQKQLLAHSFSKLEQRAKQDVLQSSKRLQTQMNYYMEEKRTSLIKQSVLLDAYSPLKILSRGYGVIYQDETIVKSIYEVRDDTIRIRMQDGFIHASNLTKEEF